MEIKFYLNWIKLNLFPINIWFGTYLHKNPTLLFFQMNENVKNEKHC